MIRLLVNQRDCAWPGSPGVVLLDVLRRTLNLVGTREGCREGDCGACLVLMGEPAAGGGVLYRPVNSCLLPVGAVAGRHIVTVEGLNGDGLNTIQQAIVDEGATQCGFCTPGIVVALTAFLLNASRLDEDESHAALAGNICRCTGYASIRRSAARLRTQFSGVTLPPRGSRARLDGLVQSGILPGYFTAIADRLATLADAPESGGTPPKKNVFVGGGTDLWVQRPESLEAAPLVFLSRRPELSGLEFANRQCRIGGATSTEEIGESPVLRAWFPGLPAFWQLISSQPIRLRATLAGNLVNASPIGDLAIFFLALDARLLLREGDRGREVPLRAFYRGYKQLDKAPGEIVEALIFDEPAPGVRSNFEKVSRRTHLDIASVNSALQILTQAGKIVWARLSAGGVGPTPLRLAHTERCLAGRDVSVGTIRGAMTTARDEIAPISDVRGSAGYKCELLGRLVAAHFLKLFPGETAEYEP